MWSTTHFPSAMRSLNPSTRAKAIEIANELLAGGYTDKTLVVITSINQARTLIRRQMADSPLSAGSVFQVQQV